jgi:large subunit ribosomal protein L22
MGNRKKMSAIALKEAKKEIFSATLKDYPVSPRKAVLVANLVRGMEVKKAMAVLKELNKAMASAFYHLIKSAVANHNNKKQNLDASLYISSIYVTQGMTLKRIQPAPQGRAHRILKRYAHIKVNIAEIQKVQSAVEQFAEVV